ncbi:MAG: hypothetical protein ACREQV_09135, partial [Candidatus Binatia bacterium]
MSTRNLVAISLLLAFAALLAFFQTPIMERWRTAAWSGVVRGIGFVFGAGIPGDENSLRDQLATLQAENLRLKAELRDYSRLRTQLGTPSYGSLRTIPAAVVGRPIDTFHSQYIINKGISSGVVINAPVVLNGSI